MQQNTQEWLQMRRSKIMASDAPIIMEQSPWKTPLQLFEEKLGIRPQPDMNSAMIRGLELEPLARQAYIDHTGNNVEPEVVFHKEFSWMGASLDGIDKDHSIIVEIKCPGEKDHLLATEGKIPEKYYAQLQHQLAVTGLNMLHYFSYRNEDFCLIEVKRDDDFILKLYKKEKKFLESLQNFTPPDLTEKDYIEKTDENWIEITNKWKNINENIKSLQQEEKECREELIRLSENQSCKGNGLCLRKIIKKGPIEYTKIPELIGINLEKYRKESTETWRISG